jgi:hypothetical protein
VAEGVQLSVHHRLDVAVFKPRAVILTSVNGWKHSCGSAAPLDLFNLALICASLLALALLQFPHLLRSMRMPNSRF